MTSRRHASAKKKSRSRGIRGNHGIRRRRRFDVPSLKPHRGAGVGACAPLRLHTILKREEETKMGISRLACLAAFASMPIAFALQVTPAPGETTRVSQSICKSIGEEH